ncbi:hypothetical protein EMWEY_00042990 [Eimeria maxima]|uniref:Uncharacterized protein n=1 Tax=Eimeria maxima TaxID=5804 RepID=U6MGN3_EIMMA|nr:hypothetical protein EMWEY_00042990 [Eimeria maxima]CDJ61604.1 hypothetical protein EMWEY_00042990 [Eimeria maxima]
MSKAIHLRNDNLEFTTQSANPQLLFAMMPGREFGNAKGSGKKEANQRMVGSLRVPMVEAISRTSVPRPQCSVTTSPPCAEVHGSECHEQPLTERGLVDAFGGSIKPHGTLRAEAEATLTDLWRALQLSTVLSLGIGGTVVPYAQATRGRPVDQTQQGQECRADGQAAHSVVRLGSCCSK